MSLPSPTPLKPIPKEWKEDREKSRFIDSLTRRIYSVWNNSLTTINRLKVDITAVGNVGTGEDDLISVNVDPNVLLKDNGVRITAWGTTANNANAKTLKVYFGSLIQTITLPASVAGVWKLTAYVFSTSVDNQKYVSELHNSNATIDQESGTLTESESAAITVKCTGTATTTNDITQEGLVIELIN